MDPKKIENQLSLFYYELENEDRLVRVGLKDKLETAKIYAKYKDLFTSANLKVLSEASKKSSQKEKEIIDRLYFVISGNIVGQKTAPAEDAIKTYFAQAKVKAGDNTFSYFELSPKIAKENVFEKREFYDDLASEVVAKINPKQEDLLKREIEFLKDFGFDGYLEYFQEAKNFDYGAFYKVVTKIVKDTQSIWDKNMARVSGEVLKRPFKKIRSCHLLYLRSLSMFDSFYPAGKVVGVFEKLCEDLGLSDLLANIAIDDKDRPKKNPRAVCYWPKLPSEVHLVIKPIGGEQDYEAMLHEGGHALHGAAIDNSLPYTFRAISRTNALTEAYAFVLESLAFDSLSLTNYLNVSTHSGSRILWQASFVDLMMLRRYLGKFLYEYEMFKKQSFAQGPKLYAKNLQDTTGFIHKEINWLTDMDGGFYSAEYLRAWIGAAQIKDYMVRKFSSKWFVNEKAGKFLRELYSSGVMYELEDVVKKLGYKPFDVNTLLNSYKKLLV